MDNQMTDLTKLQERIERLERTLHQLIILNLEPSSDKDDLLRMLEEPRGGEKVGEADALGVAVSESYEWTFPKIPAGYICRDCKRTDLLPFDEGAYVCRNCHWNYSVAKTKFGNDDVEVRYWKEKANLSVSIDDGEYNGTSFSLDESSIDKFIDLLNAAKVVMADFKATGPSWEL